MFISISDVSFDPFSIVFIALLMIPLVISTIVFIKRPSRRMDLLYCLGILGGFECILFYHWPGWVREFGLLLGFATLTGFGVMATLYLTKKRRYRILGGVVFLVLGCLLMILLGVLMVRIMNYASFYDAVIVYLLLLLFLSSTALAGGILILVTAFKK